MEEKKENVAASQAQDLESAKTQKKAVKKKKKEKSITIKANKKGRHISAKMNFLRILLIPLSRVFRPFRYYGNKKVKDGAFVYVCNHYSIFDLIYPAWTTWEIIHFIAKRENFETPIIGGLARTVRAICANRDGNDVRAMLDSIKCLKNGEKICIFPEGTRNKTGEDMLPFHHGAAVLSIKTKSPIIPMMIYKKPKFFRMTHILMGEPIELTEYYDKKLGEAEYEEADKKLYEIMLELRKKHTEFLESKKKKKA